MMNGRRKSDRPVVATKPANKVGATANTVAVSMAERVERRGLARGKSPGQNTNRAQDREVVQSALSRIRQAAVKDKPAKFTSLMHHIYNLSTLREAYFALKRDAAPGVDGETWRQYRENLESNLADLSARLRRGAYRAKPVRRAFITKDDGRQRPLGVTALEDKIAQRATVEVLNPIYETDFLGFSYGYRPGKSPHHALDALYTALLTRKVNWILDGDLSSFFDGLDHEWLIKFVEHRIADQRVVRLIRKRLNAGVLEEGQWLCSDEGTPQGGSTSRYDVFEKREGNQSTVNAQLKIVFLQPLDESTLFVKNRDGCLDEFCIDSQYIVCLLRFARVLSERRLSNDGDDEQQRSKNMSEFTLCSHNRY